MFASNYLRTTLNNLKPLCAGFLQNTPRRLVHHKLPAYAAAATNVQTKSQNLSQLDANRKARIELTAAYRGLEKLNLNEGVCNHLSLMAPAANGNGEVMLVIPYGLHWSEVRNNLYTWVQMDVKVKI